MILQADELERAMQDMSDESELKLVCVCVIMMLCVGCWGSFVART